MKTTKVARVAATALGFVDGDVHASTRRLAAALGRDARRRVSYHHHRTFRPRVISRSQYFFWSRGGLDAFEGRGFSALRRLLETVDAVDHGHRKSVECHNVVPLSVNEAPPFVVDESKKLRDASFDPSDEEMLRVR